MRERHLVYYLAFVTFSAVESSPGRPNEPSRRTPSRNPLYVLETKKRLGRNRIWGLDGRVNKAICLCINTSDHLMMKGSQQEESQFLLRRCVN
ncbi:hypothetical protein RRG08_012173 [Elysia crispata]|uniref:Uncharacterized protein n=1 Tax=Elysia crispata TaxID=231223 RepID=A0AAE1DH66_9GAST|nr:hypothetical protein RRG08_012173 [Elysia crispata]